MKFIAICCLFKGAVAVYTSPCTPCPDLYMGFNSDSSHRPWGPATINRAMNITTVFLNIITMYFIQQRWRSSTDHLLGNIKSSWPPSATSYSNMNFWMPPNRSRVLQQPSPKPLLVSYIVPAIPVIMRKQAHGNPTGQQHNDAWGNSASYNELFPVSDNLNNRSQGHITIFPVLY